MRAGPFPEVPDMSGTQTRFSRLSPTYLRFRGRDVTMDAELQRLANQVLEAAKTAGIGITVAESCTGGWWPKSSPMPKGRVRNSRAAS